jgi:outer membrane protein TolC
MSDPVPPTPKTSPPAAKPRTSMLPALRRRARLAPQPTSARTPRLRSRRHGRNLHPGAWIVLGVLAARGLGAQAPADPAPTSQAAPGSPVPLTLRRAAALAVEHSPGFGAARAQAAAGEAQARLAEDAFAVEAVFSTTPGYSRGLPVAVAGRVPAVAGVEAHKTLYDEQRRSEAIEARAEAIGQRSGFESARLAAARAGVEAYAEAWAGDAAAAAADRRLQAQGRARERVEALRREGRATDLELEQARLAEARAKLRRFSARTERDLDRGELRRLTGLPPDHPLPLGEDPAAVLPAAGPGPALAAARANDAELRYQGQQIDLLDRAARLRGGIPAPTVEAEAQYFRLSRANGVDQFYRTFKSDDWSIALAISYPLWSGGRLRDATAKSEANRSRLGEQRRAREQELARQAERAEAAAAEAAAAADVAHQARAVGAEAARLARVLAGEGRGEPGAVEARETDLADAEEEAARADLRFFQARLELLALRGELAPALLGDAPAAPAGAGAGSTAAAAAVIAKGTPR